MATLTTNGQRATPHVSSGPARLSATAFTALAQLYFVALFAWLVLYLLFADGLAWLFAINSFAVYLFAPLPLAAVGAAVARRPWNRALWAQCALAGLVWAYFFGALFLPPPPVAQAGGPRLRVLTANLLGYNQDTHATLAALRAANADVIALQELNPAVAAALQTELAAEFPYQVLDPSEGVRGGGLISRYPLQPTGEALGAEWLGTPHIVAVDVDGQVVTLIRFHAHSGLGRVPQREAAAQAIADYAAGHAGPLIAAGDLNATGLSRAHAILTRDLGDAWESAGWGLGHTFPGAASPGSSRPRLLGLLVPQWLIRIDYVFYSAGLTPLSAQVGPWDDVSDHRPVLVEFAVQK